MKYLLAITMFVVGVALGSAMTADAHHEKPCVTVTPTRTPTKTPTATSNRKCAEVVGKPCITATFSGTRHY